MKSHRQDAVVIEARGLHRFYRRGDEEVAALLDASLAVHRGEIVAVRGPSGSGKSTLLAVLAGLDEPDGGAAFIGGQRMSHQPGYAAAQLRRRSVGVLTQASGLIDHLTIHDNVALAHQLRESPSTTPRELVAAVGLEDRRHAYPAQLSGGETARAGLAVALCGPPLALLADEPTAEVSYAEEEELLALIRRLRPSAGGTLVVTHSPQVVEIADRVLEMRAGRLVA